TTCPSSAPTKRSRSFAPASPATVCDRSPARPIHPAIVLISGAWRPRASGAAGPLRGDVSRRRGVLCAQGLEKLADWEMAGQVDDSALPVPPPGEAPGAIESSRFPPAV